ncbi:hypothetical protein LJC18_03530 [Lachnospiraceae bacterium OttesenSCG-928-E19]|nr:hypothetical protein [Lachnospiraceae bacterium OttesenSCG-928-E19]
MKKVLAAVLGLVVLAGCSSHFDYYKGDVRYVQEGTDCVYYTTEQGRKFSEEIRGLNAGKKVVYRNTLCADLYARDTFGEAPRADRKILTTAAEAPTCNAVQTCNTCAKAQPVMKRRYVIVSQM